MEEIFHEKQEGQLCAQHCLNSLLQGPFYTAIDLATIARHLDEEERRNMAEGGVDNDEYRRFVAQPSSNMDDTGFFSVQVIANAIRVWGLEIVSYSSSDAVAVAAKANPKDQKAFICNYREHWFTIRKLGNQWFNLNSLLTGPELISDTFLGLFLAQLETEGYTVYVVVGELPDCQADQVLRLMPAIQTVPPRLINENSRRRGTASVAGQSSAQPDSEDAELEAAMAMSLATQGEVRSKSEEDDLNYALQLSKTMMEQERQMTDAALASSVADQTSIVSEEDQIQEAIAKSLKVNSADEELQRALAMSMETSAPRSEEKPKSSPTLPAPKENPLVQKPEGKSPSPSKLPKKSPSQKSSKAAPTETEGPSLPQPSPRRRAAPPKPSSEASSSATSNEGHSLGGEAKNAGGRQSTPDPDELRRRRLAFLDKMNK